MKNVDIFRMVLAIALIAGIGIFLLIALRPFYGALLGAMIFFFLFHPVQRYLVEQRKWKRPLAASAIIVATILLIVVPTFLLLNTLFSEITRIAQNPQLLDLFLERIASVANSVGFDTDIERLVEQVVLTLRSLLGTALWQVSQGVLSFTIFYLAFYYLLIKANDIHRLVIDILPFSKKHSQRLYDEFRRVTFATLISTGVIAVLQAVVLTILLLFFATPGAFFWGALGAVFSFLPIVGVTLIYLLIAAAYALMGSYGIAIALVGAGVFFGNADNFIRGPLAQRFGRLHPLVTVLGLFIGVPTFGLVGIVIGPLLLSYFLLMLTMFKQEYITSD